HIAYGRYVQCRISFRMLLGSKAPVAVSRVYLQDTSLDIRIYANLHARKQMSREQRLSSHSGPPHTSYEQIGIRLHMSACLVSRCQLSLNVLPFIAVTRRF